MKVLFVASELHPLVKTGGLADVVGALPAALAQQGLDVKVLLPAYPGILERLQGERRTVAKLRSLFGGPASLESGRTAGGADVIAIDAPHLYKLRGRVERTGGPYGPAPNTDWDDNHLRFAALGWTAAAIAGGRAGPWVPDVVHAHDWQAGLAPAYLALGGAPRPATVLTIHNIAFQGLFGAENLAELRLPEASFHHDGVEFYGRIGFLKAGIYYADRITTVSPTYAHEIRTPAFGHGLDGLLGHRADKLSGILNGIDRNEWNPERDPHLAAHYGAASLAGKAANKAALQKDMRLRVDARAPLLGVISRLTSQKGLDLLLSSLPELRAAGAQLVVLGGEGDRDVQAGFSNAAASEGERIAVRFGYDEKLAHRIQAGADAIVVPSRFEPCGLTQMCGMRYGTVPIVARVGGLADSVIDANEAALNEGVATGIQFAPTTADALRSALARTFELYGQPAVWDGLRRRAMAADFGWERSAKKYVELYKSLLKPH